MTIFDPVASAQTSLWWWMTGGGMVAQTFLDSDVTAADAVHVNHLQPATGILGELLHESRPEVSAIELCSSVAKGEAQWLDGSFPHDGGNHRFKLYIPSAYHGKPLPVIVMLHGAQQDPDDIATGTRMNAAAEVHGYIVVYPEQPESANLLRCWNWFSPTDRTRESGEAATVAAMTRAVMAMLNADAERVYVAGMSAGGAMAVNLVLTHPDLFAAAAVHSGIAYGVAHDTISALCAMNDGMGTLRLPNVSLDGLPVHTVPMIIFHGDADDTVHPRNGEQIVALARLGILNPSAAGRTCSQHAGASDDDYAYTRERIHDEKGVTVCEHWVVHGLGHAWSGGDSGGNLH
jgi:poly(hydroxyalkanoate) depolymerase family esterase